MPPGTFTLTLLSNFFLIPIIAHADVPVPEDKVSPAPLSNILALISFFEMILTISKFILFGKAGCFQPTDQLFLDQNYLHLHPLLIQREGFQCSTQLTVIFFSKSKNNSFTSVLSLKISLLYRNFIS